MKKTAATESPDEMRPEYDFDYSKAKAVNKALRAFIEAMPQTGGRRD